MSTTTTAPSSASSTQHSAPAQPGTRHAQGQPPADLFSQLLALAGDAVPTEPGAADAAPLADADQDKENGTEADPLAQLLAWVAPLPMDGAAAAAPGGSGLVAETRSLDGRAERLAGEGGAATARRAGAGWQAASALGSARTQGNTATVTASPAAGDAGGAVPAMHWSRAAAPTDMAASAAWPVRSTVALDSRLPSAAAPAGLAATLAATASAPEAEALPGAAPTVGGRLSGDSAAALVSAAAGSAESGLGTDGGAEGGGSFGESSNDQNGAQDPYAAPADAEAVQVQHWGTGALRHASLRVGENGAEAQGAIDIQLKLQGDEVQLDIRTDDAAARELLREQAQASLGERLQQGGLNLGSVSVGEQGQGQGTPERRDSGAALGPAPRAEAAPAPAAPQAATAQAGGRGALDLFI